MITREWVFVAPCSGLAFWAVMYHAVWVTQEAETIFRILAPVVLSLTRMSQLDQLDWFVGIIE